MTALCWLTLSVRVAGQEPATNKTDKAAVDSLLTKGKELAGSEPELATVYSLEAKQLAERINYTSGVGYALKNLGFVYIYQSKPFEAIQYWTEAKEVFQSINDQVGVSNMLSNIGVVYHAQGDYEKALANHLESLRAAELARDKLRIVTALHNIGTCYALKKETYDKALKYYLRALPLWKEITENNDYAGTAANIGEVYFNKGNEAEALHYYEKALKAYEEANDEASLPFVYNSIGKVYLKQGRYDAALRFHGKAYTVSQSVPYNRKQFMTQSLLGLANTYTAKGDHAMALRYYRQAEDLGREINALDELKDIYRGLSGTYAQVRRYDKAFEYQTLYTGVKDTLYNIATDKKLATMEFDFNLQKKEGEITLLTKDKTLKELELKRQKQAKYAFMGGLALLGLIAFILFRNYRAKVKINKVLDHQKDQIEGLLLNILPAEVARELQETGTSTPRHFENVSVLFSDFKGFTTLADKMSPQELVEELSACFTAFDNIIEKHKLEKIKTIGDAYMCAGGLPVPDKDHHFRIIRAGMEIQDYILKNNLKRKAKGLAPWDIRIGIHTGPVVAGVVGLKKYAYDIWGSTVNIASRMESNGAPGQINISSAMYDIIKDKYVCSHRGKIYAKNVGEIDMYFLEHEIKIPVRDFQPDVILQ
jgi:class 3 adenylate cyclase/lipopolysaccharide biosynthesis regulator YciM